MLLPSNSLKVSAFKIFIMSTQMKRAFLIVLAFAIFLKLKGAWKIESVFSFTRES